MNEFLELEERIVAMLKTVFDPEIPVNIYDLGLIYRIEANNGDVIIDMTVEPGFGGQSFMADMMPKARALRDEITKRGLDVMVEVDGGISEKNAALCAENGIDVLVSGSTIFGADDPAGMIAAIRSEAEKAFVS